MKHLNFWGLLTIALFVVQPSFAQLSCDQKAEELLKFKNDFPNYPIEIINEMISYITPCADFETDYPDLIDTAKAHYARGLLHVQKGDFFYQHGIKKERSYVHISKAAQLNYIPAAFTHGVNIVSHRYWTVSQPYHITQNLQKAINANYKKDIAHYALGYAKLKNFTSRSTIAFTPPQLVTEAKQHFETSTHPMAKHWLAIMHYLGLGTPVDKTKANQILSDNNIYNSNALLQHLQTQTDDWVPITAEERLASLDNFNTLDVVTDIIQPNVGDITKFTGHLLEYDWTGKGVRRYIPITFEIKIVAQQSRYKEVDYTMVIGQTTETGTCKLYTTSLNLLGRGSLTLPLDRLLQDHPNKPILNYILNYLAVKQTTINGQAALVMASNTKRLYGEIKEFDEPIRQPLRFILYPEASNTALASIDTPLENAIKTTPIVVDKNFAVVSPNPIGNQFRITYTLDQQAEVTAAVYDFFGQQHIQVPAQKNTANGEQVITIDSSRLSSGTYIIQMTIDGQPYSKMVIKE